MSNFLPDAYIASFDDMVKLAYQKGSLLRTAGALRVKTGVVGSTHRFTLASKGVATPRTLQTDVIPMGITYTNATATMSDWNAPEYTDVFAQAKINFDEQSILADTIGMAIGRREDQLSIDAMDASTFGTTSTNIGGTSTNLNTAKMRDAKRQLDAVGAPGDARYFAMHANNLFGLLGDTTATSADFNTIRALVDGQINTWLGFKTIMFETRTEGGLPVAASVRTCFAFHGGQKGAVGLAVNMDKRTEVNYIAEKTSWLANGLFSAGAAVIDPQGGVEVACTEP
jgi:hypothetical protein